MQKRNMRNQKGFTLVEIAIVLVIVGLLIGGILKGQEMVKSGKVKKSTKQMEQLVAAINAYQDKNGKMPGVVGGDALVDLDAAKLITGSNQTNPFGGTITATYQTAAPNAGRILIVSNQVPDYVAYKMDKEMDDGDGANGDMLNGAGVAYTTDPTATPPVESAATLTLNYIY